MDSCYYIYSLYEYNLIDKKNKERKKKYTIKDVSCSFNQIMIFEFLPKKKIFEISFGSKYLFRNLKLKSMYKKYYQTLKKIKEYPNFNFFSSYSNEELSNENIYYFDVLTEIIKKMKSNKDFIYEIPYNHIILTRLKTESLINNYKVFFNVKNLLPNHHEKINNIENIEFRCNSIYDLDSLLNNKYILNRIINLNLKIDFKSTMTFPYDNLLNLKSLILENEGPPKKIICFQGIKFNELEKLKISNLKIKLKEEELKFKNLKELICINSNIIIENPILIEPKNLTSLELKQCGHTINDILLNIQSFINLKKLVFEIFDESFKFSSLPLIELSNHDNQCIKKFAKKIIDKSFHSDERLVQFFFDSQG